MLWMLWFRSRLAVENSKAADSHSQALQMSLPNWENHSTPPRLYKGSSLRDFC